MLISAAEKSNAMSWMSAGFNIYGAYDILESTLQTKIFDPNKAPLQEGETPFGPLPAYLEWRPQPISNFFYASGETRDSFQSDFAARASVDIGIGAFSGHVEAAYGRGVAESTDFSFANISFLSISGNLTQPRFDEQYLSDHFKQRLAALPEKAEPSNLDVFSDFFLEFGAYFVSQITLGATLEYYVAVSHSKSITTEHISAKAEAEYKALFYSGKASAEMSSDKEWQSYRSGKHTSLRIKGGGDSERNRLNQVDLQSLDGYTPATKGQYDAWLGSISSNPAVMDFRLKGIWEVCGAKRKTVEDAFRAYGKLMRPLLHAETKSYVDPSSGFTPGIFLGGRQVPVAQADIKNAGWGGLHMIVLDRKHPDIDGVRWSKLYNFPPVMTLDAYRAVYTQMLQDLSRGEFRSDNNFLILCTYGMVDAFPPTPDFLRVLQEAGGGYMLRSWVNSVQTVGTSGINNLINYILVGIMGSGPNAGVEQFVTAKTGNPPVVKSATLEVYFYSLGPGKNYVLGPAERSLQATQA